MNRSATVMVTVDVEDWFHSENLRRVLPPAQWSSLQLRVRANTERLLQLFNEFGIKATFFILGWVAERLPDLVRRIDAEGHEVASHGYGHERIPHLSREAFLEDVRKAKGILEDQVGKPVLGYRAPCFSITDEAADVLLEAGYAYDSSLFRVSLHDRYGSLSLSGEPPSREAVIRLANGLYEFPVSILELGSLRLPWAGGGISGCCRIPFSSGVSGESLRGSIVSCSISIRGRSTPNCRGLMPEGS